LTGDFAFAIVFPALLVGEVTETACPFSGPFDVGFEDAVVVDVGCVANPLVDETDLVVILTPAFDLKLKGLAARTRHPQVAGGLTIKFNKRLYKCLHSYDSRLPRHVWSRGTQNFWKVKKLPS
jgi:hypothetical protein